MEFFKIMPKIMTCVASAIIWAHPLFAMAQLPAPSQAEQMQAAEIAAKNAWKDKVGAYQRCKVTDRIAAKYHADRQARGKAPLAKVAMPPCTDPGAYISPVAKTESKPLEASEAHSPAGTAIRAPSTRENEKETTHGQGE